MNTSPTQQPTRWVIDFEDRTEREAAEWPDLFAIVKDKSMA